MKEENIKPIPEYIIRKIQRADNKAYWKPSGYTRFYSYFTKMEDDIVKVTVAVRNRYKKWLCKQVAVHGLHSKECLVKDMEFMGMFGYVVGWYEQGCQKFRKPYEDGVWYSADDKYYNPFAKCVNLDYITKFKKFKYSQIESISCASDIKYLRLYEQYPYAEMLVKLGLTNFALSKIVLREMKNKAFRKWIYKNKDKFNKYYYYAQVVVKAFKTGKNLDELQRYTSLKMRYARSDVKRLFGQHFIGQENKLFKYLAEKDLGFYIYLDYLRACEHLDIDMTQEKNLFPHDFNRWHDIRIDEYNTKKAEIDAKLKKELLASFSKTAEKYLPLERELKEEYVCIIAKSPSELVSEGEKLCHCVGRMNYDQKFAREESLIFFVRASAKPEAPLVTLEFDPKKKKILQCYGEHDSRPPQEILDFVNNVWLPYAKRKTQKIEKCNQKAA